MATSTAPTPWSPFDSPDTPPICAGAGSVGYPAGLPPLEELDAICRGIGRALEDERRAASTDRVLLGRGLRLRVTATGVAYAFSTPRPLDANPGDPALLCCGPSKFRAVITRCAPRAVALTIACDLGSSVPEGWELLLDAPWLIDRLRLRVLAAFSEGVQTPTRFNLTGALRVLGIGEITVAPDGLDPQYENTRRPLNEAQATAVATAFRSPLSIIAAPAGTGKTVTIGAIVEAAYRAGLRVLVCAPSHVAVDLMMMQVAERLQHDSGFAQGETLRVGGESGTALDREYGASVLLDRVVARLQPLLLQIVNVLQAKADDVAEECTRLQAASTPGTAGLLHDAEVRLEAARTDLDEAQKTVRRYARSLVRGARVVGATLARVFVDINLTEFDVVIIDEASMAQAPAVFIAAGQARHHVVIAGDPFQLSAPVKSTGPDRHWLTEDVFQRLDVIRAIQDEEFVAYLTQLTLQRRCADGICELQREVWYGPLLRTAPEVTERERLRPNFIFGTNALTYIDTAPLHPTAYHPWGRTFANDAHATLIADLLAYIESAGELPEEAGPGGQILVLSHYRGQVAAIRRLLGKQYHDRGVAVRTVHRSQGSEATTAILDLTLAANVSARVSSVLTAVRPEHDGSRLLAVATSRARSRLVVVGDFTWIERSTPRQTVLRRVIAHLLENAYRIPIEELRPAAGRLELVR